MIYDKRDVLSDSQALSSASNASTNYKNLGGDYNFGAGEPVGIAICVETAAATASGSGTFTFQVQTDSVSNFASPTVINARTIAGADLTEGSVHVLGIPSDKSCEQFVRMNYSLGGDTPTVTVSSIITPIKGIPTTNIHYAAGSSVGT